MKIKFLITIIVLTGLFWLLVSGANKASACIPGECTVGETSTWPCGAGNCPEGTNRRGVCVNTGGFNLCPGQGYWTFSCQSNPSCVAVTPIPDQCPAGQQLCADGICRFSCGYNPACSWTDNRPNCAGDGTYCGNPQWSSIYNNYYCPGNPEWFFCCPGLWPNAQGVCACPTCNAAAPAAPVITSPLNNQIIGSSVSSVNIQWNAPASWGTGCPDNRFYRIELFEKTDETTFTLLNIYSVPEGTLAQSVPVVSGKTYRVQVNAYNNALYSNSTVNFSVVPALSPIVSFHNVQMDQCGGRATGSIDSISAINLVNNPLSWQITGSIPVNAQLEELILVFVPSVGANSENSASPLESILLQKAANANAIGVKLNYNNQLLSVSTLNSSALWGSSVSSGNLISGLGDASVIDIGNVTAVTVNPPSSPWDSLKDFSAIISINFGNIFPNNLYNVYLSAVSIDQSGNRYSYNNGSPIISNINYYFKSPQGAWRIDTLSPLASLNGERFNPTDFGLTGSVSDSFGIKDNFSYLTSNLDGAVLSGIGSVPTDPLLEPPAFSNPSTLNLIGDTYYTDLNPGLSAEYTFRLGARDVACNTTYSNFTMPPGQVNFPWVATYNGNLSIGQGTSGLEISSTAAALNLGSIINPFELVSVSKEPAFSSYLLINNQGTLPTRSLLSSTAQVLRSYHNNATETPDGTLWYDYLRSQVLRKGNVITNIDSFEVQNNNLSEPLGQHLATNCVYTSGFACDLDNFSSPINVEITKQFAEGVEESVAIITANSSSQEGAQYCGGNTETGFEYSLPSSVRNNSELSLRAYGIDPSDGSKTLLTWSPKSLYCKSDSEIPPQPELIQNQTFGFGGSCFYELSWSDWGQQEWGYYIDISNSPDFSTFYNKFVDQLDPTTTVIPDGFSDPQTGTPFVPVNGATYYVRVYYITYARHTAVTSFQYSTGMCIASAENKILASNLENSPSVLGISVIVDQSNPKFSTSFGVAEGSNGYFEYNGNLEFPSNMVCDIKGIVFINGDLTLNPNFVTTGQNGCLFIARGNILLNSKNLAGSPVNYDFFQFAAVTDSLLEVSSASSQSGVIFEGTILSKNSPQIYRKLTLENSETYPSLLLVYDPRYRSLFADTFSITEYSIREE